MRLSLEIQAVIFRLKPRLEFLMLHRISKLGNFWQNLSGGVEEGENLLQTLKWELIEETGISSKQILRIIEKIHYYEWLKTSGEMKGKKIKEWVFGVEVDPNFMVELSEEHYEYRWCNFEEAMKLLKWDQNKTALFKLNEILKNDQKSR